MVRINAKTQLAIGDVTDKTKVEFAAADMHSPDGSGNGLGRATALDVLYQALCYSICTYASHGLTSGDVGKPVGNGTIIDDTSSAVYPTGVLMEVIDTDTLRIAPPGAEVTLATTLLQYGDAYSLVVHGPFVFWDLSAGDYEAFMPVDTSPNMPEMLEVIEVNTGSFKARVRGY